MHCHLHLGDWSFRLMNEKKKKNCRTSAMTVETAVRYSIVAYAANLYFTFVYRLYHLGRRGKKETFVCYTSECLGRRDVVQR